VAGHSSLTCERFSAAAAQMQQAGFSDLEKERKPFDLAHQSINKLRESICLLAIAIVPWPQDPNEK